MLQHFFLFFWPRNLAAELHLCFPYFFLECKIIYNRITKKLQKLRGCLTKNVLLLKLSNDLVKKVMIPHNACKVMQQKRKNRSHADTHWEVCEYWDTISLKKTLSGILQ